MKWVCKQASSGLDLEKWMRFERRWALGSDGLVLITISSSRRTCHQMEENLIGNLKDKTERSFIWTPFGMVFEEINYFRISKHMGLILLDHFKMKFEFEKVSVQLFQAKNSCFCRHAVNYSPQEHNYRMRTYLDSLLQLLLDPRLALTCKEKREWKILRLDCLHNNGDGCRDSSCGRKVVILKILIVVNETKFLCSKVSPSRVINSAVRRVCSVCR